MYAVGAPHPLAEPARSLLEAVGAGRVRATTTPEVLQEFAHVRARRRPRSDAAALARDFAALLAPLLAVEMTDLELGLALYEQHADLGAFDAVLAAAARERGAKALVSADSAFGTVHRLRHVDLADVATVARLLSR